MGVEARCRPSKITSHCQHMKRQPCLRHHHPRCSRCHCNHRRHLCCWRQLYHHCPCCCPLPSPLAIAVVVAVNHRRRHLCCVAVSHCRCHCHRPCHRPLPSPSQLAIAVAISVGHHCHCCRWPFPRVFALARQELYLTNRSKECSLYFFFLDSGRCTDQSRMTDQVSGGNGQHQRWVASGKQ